MSIKDTGMWTRSQEGITHASSQQSQNIDDPRDAQDIMGGLRLCITSAWTKLMTSSIDKVS
jgi:hypothetical protein|tara:strand:+ start:6814 stop:6996 length:183 start_codon:yes stop_codon:yes gene_type:complete